MTLMERAFMLDLIKHNYRRKMLSISSLLSLGILLISLSFIPSLDSSETIVSIICFSGMALIAMGLFQFGSESPWSIRGRQLTALDEHRKVDFEEMICSVPLKEFFEA